MEMGNVKKAQSVIIVVLAVLLCISAAAVIYMAAAKDKTAVVVKTRESLENPDETGKVRVKMNTYIDIYEDTMQEIDFYNLNHNRLLKLKITVDGDDIYESDYIKEGEVLEADLADKPMLAKGEHAALAEIYSYTLDKEPVGQRNVEITLNQL